MLVKGYHMNAGTNIVAQKHHPRVLATSQYSSATLPVYYSHRNLPCRSLVYVSFTKDMMQRLRKVRLQKVPMALLYHLTLQRSHPHSHHHRPYHPFAYFEMLQMLRSLQSLRICVFASH